MLFVFRYDDTKPEGALMKVLNKSELRTVYLPGHSPVAEFKDEYRAAFGLWVKVWSQFLRELPEPKEIVTDHFTRQDEVCAVFCGKTCVGLVLHRWINFDVIDFKNDSYFSAWNEVDIQRLTAEGQRIFLPSYLTVHEDYRRNKVDFDIRRLLLGLMNRRFEASNANAMASTTRNTKNMNQECYAFGAAPIRLAVEFYHQNDPVDLVVTFRENVKFPFDESNRRIFESIWESRSFVAMDTQDRFINRYVTNAKAA